MINFEYYNPTRIVFGKARITQLGRLVPPEAKVLVLFGGGSVKKFGTLDKVHQNLGARQVVEFGGIEPNPRYSTLMRAVKVVRDEQIDFLLAVGGGSVMDGTKFVALAANHGDNCEDLLQHGFKPGPVAGAVPLGTVVTLPATGSEMNNGGVISHGAGKYPIFSPLVFPKFSILDPTLTFTLPPTQVANGVVDTFIHTVEQYVTVPAEGRFQDRVAEGILQTLIEIGPITLANPTDYDARANLMWCATNGLNGLIGVGVPQDCITHRIAVELTALWGIDHGRTLSIVQPWLLRELVEPKRAKLEQLGRNVFGLAEPSAEDTIAAIEAFYRSLRMPLHLREAGIMECDAAGRVWQAVQEHGNAALGTHAEVDAAKTERIVRAACG